MYQLSWKLSLTCRFRCFPALLKVVHCRLDSGSLFVSVLGQVLPLAVFITKLSELPLQLVLEAFAGGSTVTFALA